MQPAQLYNIRKEILPEKISIVEEGTPTKVMYNPPKKRFSPGLWLKGEIWVGINKLQSDFHVFTEQFFGLTSQIKVSPSRKMDEIKVRKAINKIFFWGQN